MRKVSRLPRSTGQCLLPNVIASYYWYFLLFTCALEYAFARSARAALPHYCCFKVFRRNQITAHTWFPPVPPAWFFTPQTGGDSRETVSWPIFKASEHLGHVHANPTSQAVIVSLNNGVRTLIAGECPWRTLASFLLAMRVGYVNLQARSDHWIICSAYHKDRERSGSFLLPAEQCAYAELIPL